MMQAGHKERRRIVVVAGWRVQSAQREAASGEAEAGLVMVAGCDFGYAYVVGIRQLD